MDNTSFSNPHNATSGFDSENDRDYSGFIISIVPLAMLMPITLYSTIFVILAPFYMRRLRSPDNLIMGSLACSDFLVGLLTPVYLLYLHPDTFHIFRATKTSCSMYVFSQTLPQFASLFHLLLMAIDRFFAISFPYFYVTEMGTSTAYVSCSVVWILATAKASFDIIYLEFDESKPMANRCTEKDYPYWEREYVTNILVALCLFVSLLLCLYISVIVVKQRTQIFGEARKTKFNAVLMFAFIFLWLPTIIFRMFIDYSTFSVETEDFLFVLENIFLRVNSCANGFIFSYSRVANKRIYKFMMHNKPKNWNHLASSTRTVIAAAGYWAPHNSYAASATESTSASRRSSFTSCGNISNKDDLPSQKAARKMSKRVTIELNMFKDLEKIENLENKDFKPVGILIGRGGNEDDSRSRVQRKSDDSQSSEGISSIGSQSSRKTKVSQKSDHSFPSTKKHKSFRSALKAVFMDSVLQTKVNKRQDTDLDTVSHSISVSESVIM